MSSLDTDTGCFTFGQRVSLLPRVLAPPSEDVRKRRDDGGAEAKLQYQMRNPWFIYFKFKQTNEFKTLKYLSLIDRYENLLQAYNIYKYNSYIYTQGLCLFRYVKCLTQPIISVIITVVDFNHHSIFLLNLYLLFLLNTVPAFPHSMSPLGQWGQQNPPLPNGLMHWGKPGPGGCCVLPSLCPRPCSRTSKLLRIGSRGVTLLNKCVPMTSHIRITGKTAYQNMRFQKKSSPSKGASKGSEDSAEGDWFPGRTEERGHEKAEISQIKSTHC